MWGHQPYNNKYLVEKISCRKLQGILFFVIINFFVSFLYADIDVQEAITILEQSFDKNTFPQNEFQKSLTPYILTVKKKWEEISFEKRNKLKGLFTRPGNINSWACKDSLPLIYDTPHFKFHYTKFGYHAYPYDEFPINGIPDIIDICAEAYEKSYRIYIEKMKFKKPLTDEMVKDNGGDERIDVYIFGSDGGWGGFATIDLYLTMKPNSFVGTAAPFFAINVNYYKWVGKARIKECLKTTCAHEFFHGIQFGYNFLMPNWFMENCAVWGEAIVYDGKKEDVFLWQEDTQNNLIQSFENNNSKLIDVGDFASPVIVDLLEDGYLDVIIGNEKDELIIYLNQTGKLNIGSKMQFLGKTRLRPAFYLLDKDNVLDLVIGQENGKIEFFKGSISIQNIVPEKPEIGIKFEDDGVNWGKIWPSIDTGDKNTSPTLGDLDGDGELELIVGKENGTISLYKRIKKVEKEEYLWECVSKKYLDINVGSYSVPVLVDIDKDKDLDLLISGENGENEKIYFYRNEGNVFNSKFILTNNNLPLLKETFFISFADIDYDEDVDLVIGLKNGEIKIFQNKGFEIDSAELDGYQDIKKFLLNRFLYFDKSITTFDGSYEYGGFLWTKFLSEKLGNEVIKVLYESFAEGSYEKLVNFGNVFSLRYAEKFGSLFKEFTLWNYFTGENYKLDLGLTQTHKDDLQKYSAYHYSKGEDFPNIQIYPAYIHKNYPLIKKMSQEEVPEFLGFKCIRFLPEGRQGTLVINFKSSFIPESQKEIFDYYGTAGYGVWLIKHLANNKVEVKEVFLYNPSQCAQVLIKDFGTNVLKIDIIISNLYAEKIENFSFTYSADILDKLPEVKMKEDIKLDWVIEKKKIENEEKEMKNGDIKISWISEGNINDVKEWLILRKKYIKINEGSKITEIGTVNNIKKEMEDFFSGKDDYTGDDGIEKDGMQIDDINIIASVSKEKTEFIDTTTFLDIDMKYLKEGNEQKILNYSYFYYYAVIPVYANNFWGIPCINTTKVLNTENNIPLGAINPVDEIIPEIKTKVNISLGKCEVILSSSEGLIFVNKAYCEYSSQKKVDLELQFFNKEKTELKFLIPISFLNLEGEYKIKFIAMDKAYNKVETETVFNYNFNLGLSEKFLIYPNPFLWRKHQVITFVLPDKIEANENKIKIYNIVGELISEIIFEKKQKKIEWNPEKLSSGIYLYYFEGLNEEGKKNVFKGKFSIIK
ncbi:MAG: T9SS type A sorting domain-containing protein [bacterium]